MTKYYFLNNVDRYQVYLTHEEARLECEKLKEDYTKYTQDCLDKKKNLSQEKRQELEKENEDSLDSYYYIFEVEENENSTYYKFIEKFIKNNYKNI